MAFKAAAKKGDAEAHWALGLFYLEGSLAPKNLDLALAHLHEAAKLGHSKAMANLGMRYAKGEGVSQNWAKAAEWWQLAANAGNADGQYNLGILYWEGLGVPTNHEFAIFYWTEAANAGLQSAKNRLTSIQTADIPNDSDRAQQKNIQTSGDKIQDYQNNLGADAFLGGIRIDYPRIFIKDSRWRIYRGMDQFIMPDLYLDVILLAANPNVSKAYYSNPSAHAGNETPICASADGISPNIDIPAPQAPSCRVCRWNTPRSQPSANSSSFNVCREQKRVALLAAGDLGGDIYALTVESSSLKELFMYVDAFRANNTKLTAAVTRLTFDDERGWPRVKFARQRWLTEQEFSKVCERESDALIPMVIQT